MVGQTVGKYRVEDRIGRGGMGTVYRAVDETLHREVAIKVLNSELNDPEVAKRFRAEAITVARLSHPGIATVYELFEHDGQWLMVMEFVRGETLERLIERAGPLTAERAADLAMQALSALSHAHGLGVVHRDLKPANLMLTDAGIVKIMDFGIARVSGSEHLTSAGFMMGTPAYMAPEQVLGHEVDARADLYALGVVLYRLTTGRLPFKGETPFALAQSQVNDPPTPVRTAREGLPIWLEQVIARALAKAPADRFQTANDFREALKRCVSGLPMEMPVEATAPTGMMMTPPGMPTGSFAPRTPTGSSMPIVVPVPPAGTPSTTGLPLQGTGASPLPPNPADMPTTASGVHVALSPDNAYAPTALQQISTGQIQAAMAATPAAGTGTSGAVPTPGPQPAGTGALPSPTAATAPVPMPSTGARPPVKAKAPAGKSSNAAILAAAAVIVILIAGGSALLWRRHRAAADAAAAAVVPPVPTEPAAGVSTPPAPTPPVTEPPAAPPAAGAAPPAQPPPAATASAPPSTAPSKPVTPPSSVSTPPAHTAATGSPPASPSGAAGTKPPVTSTPASSTSSAGTPAAGSTTGSGSPAGTTTRPSASGSSTAAAPPIDDSFLAFKDIKYLAVKDQDSQDEDALLNFGSGQILVVPKDGGAALAAVAYKKLVHATYVHEKDPKWDATLPGPPDNLNIHGFMRGARHWLVLQTKTNYTILHLDDSNWSRVLDTVEARTGIKVDRPADGGR